MSPDSIFASVAIAAIVAIVAVVAITYRRKDVVAIIKALTGQPDEKSPPKQIEKPQEQNPPRLSSRPKGRVQPTRPRPKRKSVARNGRVKS
jgi:hypothetical protein